VKAKKAMIPTSIGPLNIKACARDYFNVINPAGTYPLVLFSIERHKDGWRAHSSHLYEPKAGKKGQASPALIEEIFALGTQWANAHPEEFERAGRKEYRQIVETAVDFTLDEALKELRETRKDLRSILDEPEFMRHAPPALRESVRNAAKMVRSMKKQLNAAGKAIIAAASHSPQAA
jgi:hypothetical protein